MEEIMKDIELHTISYQKDIEFTSKLDTISAKIVDISGSVYDVKRPGPELIKAYGELEDLLRERFGIPYKIISTSSGFSTYTLSGSVDTDIDTDFVEKMKQLIHDYNDYCAQLVADNVNRNEGRRTRKFCEKDFNIDEIATEADLFADEDSILAFVKYKFQKMLEMNRVLNNKGITIDNKRGYMDGLVDGLKGTGIKSFLCLDPKVIKENNYSARQLSYIILHEVGHEYTLIERYLESHGTLIGAYDSFTNDKLSVADKMKITAKKISGKDLPVRESAMVIFKDLKQKMYDEDSEAILLKNSEEEADRFAVMFGYGKELTETVQTFGYLTIREMSMGLGSFIGITIASFFLAMNLIWLTILPILGLVLLPVTLAMFLANFNYGFGAKVIDFSVVHPDPYIRIRKTKIALIRVLRTKKDLLPEEKINMVNLVIEINELLEKLGKDKRIYQLLMTTLSGESNKVAYNELYERMEQIMENDLHALGYKLKKLKKLK